MIVDPPGGRRRRSDDVFAYPLALEVGGVGVWSWGIAEDVCAWSPVVERLLGAETHSLPTTVEGTLDLVHPDDRGTVRAGLESLADGDEPEVRLAFRARHADGTYRWVRGSGRAQPEGGLVVGRVVVALVDVTAEREAAETDARRRALDERLHAITTRFITMPVDEVEQGIDSALGEVGRFLGADRARLALVQGADEQLVRAHVWHAPGRPVISGHMHSLRDLPWVRDRLLADEMIVIEQPDDLPADARAERALFERLGLASVVFVPLTVANRAEAVLAFACAERKRWRRELADELRRLCEACVQALRRKDLETELREANAYLAHLVESSPVVMFRGPVEGYVLDYVSANIERVLGHDPDWVAKHWVETVHPDDEQIAIDANDAVRREGTASYEARFRRGDGRWVRLHIELRVERDEAGQPIARIGYGIDVTEHRAAEKRLLQAQKLEALGHLAGGIAHDFNNLLQVIHGYGEMLADANAGPEINEVLTAAEQAQRLVYQLLTFSRQRSVEPDTIDCNATIVTVTDMLTRVMGPDVRIDRRLGEGLPPVFVDPVQIEQILVNLLVNARDAMPDGGTITVSTTVPAADELPGGVTDGVVQLTVADTGKGMNDDVLAHIFDPFFTTKPEGLGTGLGLPTVYGAVTAAGGHVDVRSAPGEGTAFAILLPQAAGRAAAGMPCPTAQGAAHEGSVLIVEDKPEIRSLVEAALSQLGYETVGVDNAEEALGLVEAGTPVDLLLTDVVMPGMKGPDLAAAIRRSQPHLKVCYMSGYGPPKTGLDEDRSAFLQKPFAIAELASCVRSLLTDELS